MFSYRLTAGIGVRRGPGLGQGSLEGSLAWVCPVILTKRVRSASLVMSREIGVPLAFGVYRSTWVR